MLLRALARYRYGIVAVLAVADGIVDGLSRTFSHSDFAQFTQAGADLVSGQWSRVFSDPWIQVGPLTLVLSGVLGLLHRLTSLRLSLLFSVVVYVAIAVGLMLVVGLLYRDRDETPDPLVTLAVGIGTIAGGMGFFTVVSGHPSETVIPLLWILAARDAVDRRGLRSGVWIAIAAGLKLWGILGLPLILLARRPRAAVYGVAMALAGLVAAYLPFLFAGNATTFGFDWRVMPSSPVALVLAPGTNFTWPMRVTQGAIVVALGAAIVLRLRGREHVVWAAPLGIVLARLVTDPLLFNYYWLAGEALALVGIALLWPRAGAALRIAMGVGFFVVAFAVLLPPASATVIRMVLLAALVVIATRSVPLLGGIPRSKVSSEESF
ncbi:MAG TPA: glycosyltransferase 87 family protein [Actinomycetota bacterium]|nr:glycosyltransferase 87 family protein [Actinomycetota bacterium]